MMRSKKRQRDMINRVYGVGGRFTREIRRMYRVANRQIKGEISSFVDSKANWSGKPSNDDIQEAVDELAQFSEDVKPLVNYYASSLLLGHPKNGDVVTAHIAVPLIKVADQVQGMVSFMGNHAPKVVHAASREQHRVTPQLHKIPYNYDVMLQRSVSESVTQREQISTNINRDIQQTISRVRDVCKQASQDTDAHHDYSKDVDRILTGKDGKGGASAKAQTIMRTQSCRELSGSRIDDMKARGVTQYRFISLEAQNTCLECSEMDGNTYDVEDAQEGVNLPPMHPNCQCTIEPVEDTDTDDLPTLDEMMDNPDLFE